MEKQRLIDVDALIADIKKNNKENFYQSDWSSRRVCELLEESTKMPHLQPKNEPIRCKECRKWDKTRRFGISCACSHWSPSIKDCRFTLPDDFCSNGVKEEGAEE